MFKKTKEKLEMYRENNKEMAVQITAYNKENEKLKYKLNKIQMMIEQFDFRNGNAFSLMNQIKSEAKYE